MTRDAITSRGRAPLSAGRLMAALGLATLPTDGPLRPHDPGSTIGGAGWCPSEDFVRFRTDVPLENTWAEPVTIDIVGNDGPWWIASRVYVGTRA